MKAKLLSLFIALAAATTLWASNVITYTATEKLSEAAGEWVSGLHTKAFNVEITSHEFSYGTGIITFAGDVTAIGNKAFYYCSGLTSIEIPNSVTTIGSWAFSGCSGLTSITIPHSVTSIEYQAFESCTGLTSVTIEGTITSCFPGFNSCPNLISFTIGEEVQSIPHDIFGYIAEEEKTITSVTWNAKNCSNHLFSGSDIFGKQVKSFVFGDKVEVIPYACCAGMTNLTSMVIPNSVDSVGTGAFTGCTGLTAPIFNANCFAYMPISYIGAYIVPQGIKQIAGYAFGGCSGLTSITIPHSVTTIGPSAFSGCSGLKSIQFDNTIPPPMFDLFAFTDVPTSATIFVPCGYALSYKKVSALCYFKNYSSFGDFPYVLTLSSSDNTIGTTEVSAAPDCITNEATIKAIVTKYGYHFDHWSDGYIYNPRTIVVDGDKSYTAIFSADQFTITAYAENGSVNGAGIYDYGTAVTLTATPNEGYEFVNWSNGVTDNPYTFIVEQNVELTANFKKIETGWQDIHSGINATKFFHNGNLIIERNGVKYTVTGQKVR